MKTTKESEPVFQRAGLHGDVGAGAVIGGGGGGGRRHRRADRRHGGDGDGGGSGGDHYRRRHAGRHRDRAARSAPALANRAPPTFLSSSSSPSKNSFWPLSTAVKK
jgi:hypothetical protein